MKNLYIICFVLMTPAIGWGAQDGWVDVFSFNQHYPIGFIPDKPSSESCSDGAKRPVKGPSGRLKRYDSRQHYIPFKPDEHKHSGTVSGDEVRIVSSQDLLPEEGVTKPAKQMQLSPLPSLKEKISKPEESSEGGAASSKPAKSDPLPSLGGDSAAGQASLRSYGRFKAHPSTKGKNLAGQKQRRIGNRKLPSIAAAAGNGSEHDRHKSSLSSSLKDESTPRRISLLPAIRQALPELQTRKRFASEKRDKKRGGVPSSRKREEALFYRLEGAPVMQVISAKGRGRQAVTDYTREAYFRIIQYVDAQEDLLHSRTIQPKPMQVVSAKGRGKKAVEEYAQEAYSKIMRCGDAH